MKKLLPLIFLFLPFISFGQTPFKWDFGGGLGITSYQGDLDALKVNTGFREIHFSVAAYLRRNLSNNFATRIGLVAGKLAGDDANFAEPEWRVLRGIYFESPFAEVTAIAEYYPLGMYPKRGKSIKARRAVAPYLFIGVGGAYSNPTVFWNDTNGNEYIDPEAAQRDKEAKTNKVNIVTPLGLGLRFLLKDHSTFGLEAALRPTYSDYLDGVSQAGNPNENDWYFTAQIGFSYPFGKNKRNKPIAKTEELKEKTKEKPRQKDLFVDTDKDGIADFDDDCPITPGLKSLKGCPDKDGDGVADKYDLCSEQPGPVELNGCPDSDGDGIADKDDKCPDVAGIADQKGCPALPPPDKAIYFRAAQDNWYRTSDETLDEVVGILKNDNSLKAIISGHTDDAAETATANLSGNRAKKVYDFLVSQGIPPSRLQFTGKGSSQPVSEKLLSDDPLLNQQLRRRVEVRFTRE